MDEFIQAPEFTRNKVVETATSLMVIAGCAIAISVLIIQGAVTTAGHLLRRRNAF